jgi:hypothetical protein
MSKIDRNEILDRAQRMLEQTQPLVKRLVDDAKPRINDATRGAVRYAREHDKEIAGVAMALFRARTVGSWRLAATAVGGAVAGMVAQKGGAVCRNCRTVAPSKANFCTECGASLAAR